MQWLNIILFISGVSGVAAGTGLLLMQERMPWVQNHLRQWLLERDLAALLNRYRRIERPLYRHHHIFGAAVIAGAFVLLAFLGKLHIHLFATGASTPIPGVRLAMLAGWVLAILTLVIGITIVIRPSTLKEFEAVANRWIEPFPVTSRMTVPAYNDINRLILRFPKQAGMLLLLAGVVCLRAFAAMS